MFIISLIQLSGHAMTLSNYQEGILEDLFITIDQHAVRELELSAENNCNERINGYGKIFTKFWKAGTFNKDRAIDWVARSILLDAAKDYCLGSGMQWREIFPKPVRTEAAKNIVEGFISEFEAGNYWN